MKNTSGYEHLLPEGLAEQLLRAAPEVQSLVVHLVSGNAAQRLAGVDQVFDHVLRQDELMATAAQAAPFLLSLATAPAYPEASALLLRMAVVLSTIDDPPRSLSRREKGNVEPTRALQLYRECGLRITELVRVARKGTDPEGSRTAACMVARFPEADRQTEPTLIALLSGAPDGEGRARLLYALTRVQAAHDGPYHPRIGRALGAARTTQEQVAAALALTDAAVEGTLAEAARSVVSRIRDRPGQTTSWSDPRGWGRRLML